MIDEINHQVIDKCGSSSPLPGTKWKLNMLEEWPLQSLH